MTFSQAGEYYLVAANEEGTIVPAVCTINFKLREGVKFHNGDELRICTGFPHPARSEAHRS